MKPLDGARAGRRRVRTATVLLLALAAGPRSHSGASGSGPRQAAPPALFDAAGAICARVQAGDVASLPSLTPAERQELTALYTIGACEPLWVDGSGTPTADALVALGLLRDSAADGLVPADYGSADLIRRAEAMAASGSPGAHQIAELDIGLSAGTLRYLRQLHEGRVNPRAAGFHVSSPADDRHDYPAELRAAVLGHRIERAAAAFTPPLALYRRLREVLAHYRALGVDAALIAPQPARTSVHPGDSYAGVDDLRRLLVAVGDLPSTTLASPSDGSASQPVYERELVEAVRRFQARHGLDADGVLGRDTWAALGVPLAWRARQIELALERLRWLPHLDPQRFVAVNIPMYRLWAWTGIPPDGAPRLGMNVIVGRGLNRQTPVFVDEIEHVVFRPFWNVPASIARGEILPAVARDAGYLERHHMEIVSGQGDDARRVPATAKNLRMVRAGELRVRQRPGPGNALGLVKFVFPNDANVYLHDTPATELFSRARRNFSHGCVRVEDPVTLAEWVLAGEDGWTRQRIEAAMNGADSRRVALRRPIQVILFYVTAVVMPEDGTVHFAEDLYGHDARLDAALVAR